MKLKQIIPLKKYFRGLDLKKYGLYGKKIKMWGRAASW